MKASIHILFTLSILLSTTSLLSQDDKRFIGTIGIGYSNPFLSHSGVVYDNAEFAPDTGPGISYFASVDYSINKELSVGIGINGIHNQAEFIKDPSVGDAQVDGYLEKGNVSGLRTMLRISYASSKEGFSPFARIAIGLFQEQAEMGDVPLELTQDIETEIFPDFKYAGLGLIPEVGVQHEAFSFSIAYSIPFGELEGEEVPEGYESLGSVTLQGLQLNVGYRIALF